MRILHLAWEYPPVMYGGLGRHVHALATAQAANGHDVTVITQSAPRLDGSPASADGELDGVRVLRASVDSPTHDTGDLLGHVTRMEQAFTADGATLLEGWHPEVIHAHDWMVARAGVALRSLCPAALVATIHATEAGRNLGWVHSELSTAIHAREWWLANTSDGLITCSHAMRDEVRTLFGVEATAVIANGVHVQQWQAPIEAAERIRAELPGPLVSFTGRVEWEKGVQTLLGAVPHLRRAHPRLRVAVAGRGSYLSALAEQAEHLGVDDVVDFLGWVSEEDLRALVSASTVAVAPSLYEPSGLVALEAAALGTPVVVARTGGLAEFARDGERAAVFHPGDPGSLAQVIHEDLVDPEAARARAGRASRALVSDYDWRDLAAETVRAYRCSVVRLGSGPEDPHTERAERRHGLQPPHFVAPLGRLLEVGR